jgi:hypothetical protein
VLGKKEKERMERERTKTRTYKKKITANDKKL